MSGCSAILLAAGRGTRLGFDKILTPLAGRPVLEYSLRVLDEAGVIDEILIPTRADIEAEVRACVGRAGVAKPVRVIAGGQERQDSVRAGLRQCRAGAEWALIHDSARPLITVDLVERVVAAAREHGGALCGQRCTDTLKQADDRDQAEATLDRSRIWRVETPQVFAHAGILAAYEKVAAEGLAVTDDASAWELSGKRARLVETGGLNLKITLPLDWTLAEMWIAHGEGPALRDDLHAIHNAMSPLTGYLPLLERRVDPQSKEHDYVRQMALGLERTLPLLERLHERVRRLFPRQPKQH